MWSAAQVRRFAELVSAYGEAKFGDEWWPGDAVSFIGVGGGHELARMFDEVDSLSGEPAILLSAEAIRQHFEGDDEIEPLLAGLSDEVLEDAARDFLGGGDGEPWGSFDVWARRIVRDAAGT